MRPIGSVTRELPTGERGCDIVRLTARQIAGAGASLPTEVMAEPPLTAAFLGAPRESTESNTVRTVLRDVEIGLPASAEPTASRGTVRFRWAEGRTKAMDFYWQVVPRIRASPRRLVLKRSARRESSTFVIKSFGDRPFRITNIGPPELVATCQYTRESSGVHDVKLTVDVDARCGGARQ